MQSKILVGSMVIYFLAVTSVICQEGEDIFVENCKEKINECKTLGSDEKDEEKKADAQRECFSGFMCDSDEDVERQKLNFEAGIRTQAARAHRFKTGMSPTTKMSLNLLAVCLVTVLGFGRI